MTQKLVRLAGAGLLAGGLLLAQGLGAGMGRGQRAGMAADPAQRAARQQKMQDFLATALNLTDDQKAQAQQIAADAQAQMKVLAPQMRDVRLAVSNAIKSGADDATLSSLAAQEGDLAGKAAAIRIKAMAKFYALLTPDQRDKADKMRGQLQGMFGGPMGRFAR